MIVPDGIEPVEEWRTWKFNGTHLLSITNGQAWKPGEALHAECHGGYATDYQWGFVRYGWSLQSAQTHATAHNNHQYRLATMSASPWGGPSPCYIPVPSVEPPQGYGYTLSQRTHETPREDCSCGIYAAKSIDACPGGDVFGKVKLWGKIIPGERGSRAEYAYPSELHVPARLAEDPAILAYGVPVVVADPASPALAPVGVTFTPIKGPSRWPLNVAISVNLLCGAWNLLVAFKVVKL